VAQLATTQPSAKKKSVSVGRALRMSAYCGVFVPRCPDCDHGCVPDSKAKSIAGRLGRLGSRVLSLGRTTPQWSDLPPPRKTPARDDPRKR
jgi:hypothetical protein